MKIGITGTPGTGKSTVSQHLDGKVVDLRDYLEENDLGEVNENGEIEVDIEELRENPPEEPEDEDLVIEGHMAHFLDPDYCIVLRCNPEVLEKRLEERDYSDLKIQENVEAEAMDVILSQAVQNQEKVYEIDSTDGSVEEVVEEIKEAVDERKESYGNVDWTGFL
ncbi:MAG: adenylate kinase family protein [Candidatus Nanosalina sp.]